MSVPVQFNCPGMSYCKEEEDPSSISFEGVQYVGLFWNNPFWEHNKPSYIIICIFTLAMQFSIYTAVHVYCN